MRDRNLVKHTQPVQTRTTGVPLVRPRPAASQEVNPNTVVRVLLASPLEPELAQRIAAVDERLDVGYRPELVGIPRYPADHHPPVELTPAQAAEWAALLAEAEVLFDVDQASTDALLSRAPRLRWIQSSSSGIGEWVRRLGLVNSRVTVTNAAGIHAAPLAEFVVFAMLYFAKRWPRMAAEQRAHHWQRCATDSLHGKTLAIIGLGNVGRHVARMARPFGLRVIATRRSGAPDAAADQVFPPDQLETVLRQSDYLVLSLPLLSDTDTLIGASQLSALKPSAVLINIARGAVVDAAAMVDALRSGRLAGAALDVTSPEPLPADSPLWDMPNVLITPHSMSTAYDENQRLVDLFCDNLRRYLAGEPLRNVFNTSRGY
jgi:glyoxylate/hydroxypyruvate reductase